jgi:hypothetical protein
MMAGMKRTPWLLIGLLLGILTGYLWATYGSSSGGSVARTEAAVNRMYFCAGVGLGCGLVGDVWFAVSRNRRRKNP